MAFELTHDYSVDGMRPLIQQMVDMIVRHYDPKKIILFGSYACGTPHQHSDVDLMVVLDDYENKMRLAAEMGNMISGIGMMGKDVMVCKPEHLMRYGDDVGYVYYHVAHGGVTLYER